MTKFIYIFRYALLALAVSITLFAGGFLLFTNAIERDSSTPQAAEGVVALTGGKDRIGQAWAVNRRAWRFSWLGLRAGVVAVAGVGFRAWV